jgi:NAD-dependent deacetylase
VRVITQNVDDLHEKAGSSHILHLHGELMKMRSIAHPDYVEAIDPAHPDTTPETRGKNGDYMRPHIVFFEESVPNMEAAVELVRQADIFVVIGTSLVVYPAASLLNFVPSHAEIYYIDLNPAAVSGKVHVIQAKATEGMRQLCDILQSKKGL